MGAMVQDSVSTFCELDVLLTLYLYLLQHSLKWIFFLIHVLQINQLRFLKVQ